MWHLHCRHELALILAYSFGWMWYHYQRLGIGWLFTTQTQQRQHLGWQDCKGPPTHVAR